mmetsp:Transcript_6478/g.13568  ORF Transcript_6478/g.13568 Transcript_6478/m.13568 type:complete len:174 (-) Transcript_6478:84-605(-)
MPPLCVVDREHPSARRSEPRKSMRGNDAVKRRRRRSYPQERGACDAMRRGAGAVVDRGLWRGRLARTAGRESEPRKTVRGSDAAGRTRGEPSPQERGAHDAVRQATPRRGVGAVVNRVLWRGRPPWMGGSRSRPIAGVSQAAARTGRRRAHFREGTRRGAMNPRCGGGACLGP